MLALTPDIARLQRLTVTATDALLMGAAAYALDPAASGLTQRRSWLAFALVAAHAGLLLVDHIHFQYNGVLLGALTERHQKFSMQGEGWISWRNVRGATPVLTLQCHRINVTMRRSQSRTDGKRMASCLMLEVCRSLNETSTPRNTVPQGSSCCRWRSSAGAGTWPAASPSRSC